MANDDGDIKSRPLQACSGNAKPPSTDTFVFQYIGHEFMTSTFFLYVDFCMNANR